MSTQPAPFQVIDVDTGNSFRSKRTHPAGAIQRLYQAILENPDHDYIVIDERGMPVPASRIRQLI